MGQLHPLLEPYIPAARDPFDEQKVLHLHRRAGFGITPEDAAPLIQLGPAGCIDRLLSFPDQDAKTQNNGFPGIPVAPGLPADFRSLRALLANKTREERSQLLQQVRVASRRSIETLVRAWLQRMAAGPYPLQEKLVLFWHGHFTSSARDVRNPRFIWQQNELLRQLAAGNFGDLLRAIARDPAMLDYLDNQRNRKQRPNENFARELLELFTLGIGHYTEEDVRNAARAFTGWAHDGDRFAFRPRDHDFGPKVFLGEQGAFDGDDILRILLRRPRCARFIAGKLLRFFVSDAADSAVAESLGDMLDAQKYELRPVLRTLFTSRLFYAPRTIGAQIKGPVELLIGAARALEMSIPDDPRLATYLSRMGQVPYDPPNVQGWPGNRLWINTTTLYARQSAALWLCDLPSRLWRNPDYSTGHPPYLARLWVRRLIGRPIAPEKIDRLAASLGPPPVTESSVRRMVQLIVTLPEFQLS